MDGLTAVNEGVTRWVPRPSLAIGLQRPRGQLHVEADGADAGHEPDAGGERHCGRERGVLRAGAAGRLLHPGGPGRLGMAELAPELPQNCT